MQEDRQDAWEELWQTAGPKAGALPLHLFQ